MLIDTDVIIWHMRGNTSARDALQGNAPFELSAVTYMELVQGMRNRNELACNALHSQRQALSHDRSAEIENLQALKGLKFYCMTILWYGREGQ